MSMDKSGRVRRVCAALLAAVTAAAVTLPGIGASAEPAAEQPTAAAAAQDTAVRYRAYRAEHPGGAGQGQILLEAADGRSSAELRQLTDYAGQPGISVLLPEGSSTAWRFTVPSAGWYTVTFLYCPTDGGGNSALADLLIDGALPFAEAADLSFERRWINEDTGRFDKSGNQIRSRQTESPAFMTKAAEDAAGETGGALGFYLTAGEHTLRLRVGLGGYRDILRETDECLTELNTLYREVVTVTGTDPDVDRDYQFELLLPDTLVGMRQMIGRLAQLEERLRALGYCGDQGTDAIRRIRTQLTYMTDRPTDLARRLTTYRSDISSLGTWRNGITEQPLLLDKIYIGPADMTLPQGEAAEAVMANFACLLEVRDAVTKAIEEARNAKTVGKSQEAVLKITVSQTVADVLGAYDAIDLEELFIVSHVDVAAGDVEEPQVEVSATSEPKCPRCWNHRELGGNPNHAEVCKRCGDVLDQLA